MRLFFALLASLTLPCAPAQNWIPQTSGTTASLRGISVVDSSTAWASGSAGTVLVTLDGGTSWVSRNVPSASDLDFRGIQADSPTHAIAMSSGEGVKSTVWETIDGGLHWRSLHVNAAAKGFFDALQNGFILGDPVEGAFVLLRMPRFSRIPLPAALPGEGAFAASNTSLVVRGRDIWFATGSPAAARVFRSTDGGRRWSVSPTPLAGIFSIAFSDGLHGIAVGGDYTKPADASRNIAVTRDGGRTWTQPSGSRPLGYRSAVAWIADARLWLTAGPTGSEISRDNGESWIPFDQTPFNAISAASSRACWAVGPNGRIAKFRSTWPLGSAFAPCRDAHAPTEARPRKLASAPISSPASAPASAATTITGRCQNRM